MDRQFHCALVALCGNDTLSAEYERSSRLTFFYNISNFVPLSQSQIQQSHLDFLEVLMTADPDTAQRAVHAHIASGKQDLILSV